MQARSMRACTAKYSFEKTTTRSRSIPVGVGLEGTRHLHANVVCLFFAQLSQLCAKCGEMQAGDLFIQLFWQQVHVVLVCLRLFPVLQDVELPQDLIGERARHDKGWVACGTTQVAQTPRCEHNHTMSIRENEAIDLRFDVLNLDAREALEAC